MISRTWLLIAIAWAPLVSGCAALSTRSIQPQPQRFAAVPSTVFVTDGAGNFQYASKFLRATVEADGYPINVITYVWSHGDGRIVRDQLDFPHARCEGKKLAAAMVQYQATHPGCPIYLLAHSAGCTSALAALECLPPTVVERAVLLAPSVSRTYDIRPPLRGVKDSLHVFYSRRDHFMLGTMTCLIGLADGGRGRTAGRFGFVAYVDPGDPGLISKLVQHRWQPSDRMLGNNGGHFGGYQPDHLREYVIPLLNPAGSTVSAPVSER